MKALKRLSNISKYGLGAGARERKRADKEQSRHERFHDAGLWEHSERGRAAQVRVLRRIRRRIRPPSWTRSPIGCARRRTRTSPSSGGALRPARRSRARARCSASAPASAPRCRALHDLGYFAIGIDLNPGDANPYVLPGDFHRIVFPDASLDAVYTNALDHVFSLEQVVGRGAAAAAAGRRVRGRSGARLRRGLRPGRVRSRSCGGTTRR